MRKKTALLFSDFETLSSFISASNGINICIMAKAKILNGLFTDEDIELAVSKFSATLITTAKQSSSVRPGTSPGSFDGETQGYIFGIANQ